MRYPKRRTLIGVIIAAVAAIVSSLAMSSPASAATYTQYRMITKPCNGSTITVFLYQHVDTANPDRITIDTTYVDQVPAGDRVYVTFHSDTPNYVWGPSAFDYTAVSGTRWEVSNPDSMKLGSYNSRPRTTMEVFFESDAGVWACQFPIWDGTSNEIPPGYRPIMPALTMSTGIVKTAI